MLLLGLTMTAWAAAEKVDSIRSGVPWHDIDGNLIDAHGAGLLAHNRSFYWYGSKRDVGATGTQMDNGIALYSSEDLYNVRSTMSPRPRGPDRCLTPMCCPSSNRCFWNQALLHTFADVNVNS